ncbi:MAG: outer membrane protein assembly factor BamA [Marinilabiliaceae bacterium]|nr:outer membrane protein assembly factor BamA [Marinilabiliaceae bacterium]
MRHYSYIIICTILAILPCAHSAYSQEENKTDASKISYSGIARKYTIADIVVSGIDHMDQKMLQNLSGLKVGQVVSVPGDELTQAVKRYLSNGLFSDAKVYINKIVDNNIYLEIELKERPRLSKVNFYGIKRSEVKEVESKVAIMENTQVTPFLVKRAEKYVKDYFFGKGFYNVDVKVTQRNDPYHTGQVILDFNIDKKEKVKVRSLVFRGNKVMSYRKLNRAMKKTNEKALYNFFRTKKFIEENYRNDLVKLIEYYNEHGYRDARVLKEEVVKNDDNTVNITIDIEEGLQYHIGDITWVGNSIYSGEYLQHVLGMKRGDVYDSKKLNKRLVEDDDAVHNLYMDNGYLFSDITPIESNVYADTIDFEMRVVEGTVATINEIIIKGNDKTHERVVRREIRTKPGQLFSKAELIRTVRELANLGHFDPETINPVPKPDYDNGTVDVIYNLAEKSNDQIELSGGWGAGMFVGSLGLSFNNFSLRNIFNKEAYSPLPTGDGQKLSFKAQANGKYFKSLSMSFTEPWLGGRRPNSLSISAFISSQTGVSSSYYNNFYNGYSQGYNMGEVNKPAKNSINQFRKVSGFSVGFGKRLTWPDDWFVLYTEMGYQHYKLRNWQYFLMQDGQSHDISMSVTLSRSSIDNPIYTRQGSNFSVGLSVTPPYSWFSNHSWKNEDDKQKLYEFIEYHKWTVKGAVFKPLDNMHKLILMGKFEMGFLGYYDRYRKSPFQKYVMGGDGMSGYSTYGEETIGLRGYENASLTPRKLVNGSYSYDGNIYNKLTMELRYPITLKPQATVFALAFAEAGNCWSEFQDYSPFDLKRSAGVGLRVFLPIFGFLGLDWGYGFDDINGYKNAGGSQFHFVIGQSF